MDFFETEERARKHTAWLAALFALAVCGTVIGVYAVARGLVWYVGLRLPDAIPTRFWIPDLFWKVAAGTVALIGAASLYKTRAVNASAESVVLGLGGRLVDPNSPDPDERRLLNVVEEMAIASGIPVPAVYVLLQEPGINALAVGLDPSRAAIAVTAGSLKLLSRDELQGVVAHELSHVLNGDSRISLRLLGLVHGILVIGLIGSTLIRSTDRSGTSRLRRKAAGWLPVFLAGLSLWLIGSIGVFFARLIKAAVSRQRELLADASGVQFTRNAAGLVGALKKIAGLPAGSRLLAARAEEASHLLFGEGIDHLLSLMSTHPPLAERIRLLDGELAGATGEAAQLRGDSADEIPGVAAVSPFGGRVMAVPPRAAVASVGKLGDEHVAYAQSLLAQIPQRIRDAIREPWVARAVVLGLMLDERADIRAAQLQALLSSGDPKLADEVTRASAALRTLPREARLPLVNLALPALRRLSGPQYDQFRETVERVIHADTRISVFEYTLQRVLMRNLALHFGPEPTDAMSLDAAQAVSILLSTLSHAGSPAPAEVAKSFAAGCAELTRARLRPTPFPRESCTVRALDRALARLSQTAPRLRADIVAACAATVSSDGVVTVAEGELLRAIADALGCPMPPLLPGQHIGAGGEPQPLQGARSA